VVHAVIKTAGESLIDQLVALDCVAAGSIGSILVNVALWAGLAS